jgi:hypothetical protein
MRPESSQEVCEEGSLSRHVRGCEGRFEFRGCKTDSTQSVPADIDFALCCECCRCSLQSPTTAQVGLPESISVKRRMSSASRASTIAQIAVGEGMFQNLSL